ncbi:MAG: ABC transporter permease [Chloroflexota bacterium]|nr:MAG: ABC transporter permease [Chloroflexota bacterium]
MATTAVAGHRPIDQAINTKPPQGLWVDAWSRLKKNKAAMFGLVLVIGFFALAIFGPMLAPHDPLKIYDGKSFLPPVWSPDFLNPTNKTGDPQFFLGTDSIGRDVLSRLIYGARVSLVVAIVPTIFITILGISLGLFAGYSGGTIDNLLMRFTDIVYSFPDLLFFVVVMFALRDSFLGDWANGLILLFGALAIVNWVGIARVVRGSTLSIKEKEFIEAAHSIGTSDQSIMQRHILPNILSPIIIITAFAVPRLIITEAVLGYLGLGLRPGTSSQEFFVTSWGSLLLEGQTAINAQPWMLLAPAIAVALVVMGFTFLGDGLRDALDPRMKGTG